MKKRILIALAVLCLVSGCRVAEGIRQTDRKNKAEQEWNGNPFFAPTNAPSK